MASLTISIPDELADQARTMGLLDPRSIAALLREEIRRRQIDELFAAADRLRHAELPAMSSEEIQAEITAARAELRATRRP